MIRHHPVDAVPITPEGNFWFGYYDKFPWNASGRHHLAMRAGFIDRQPGVEDAIDIGLIDTANGNAWTKLAETTAWSWQQGTMLQWLPSDPDRKIIYNIRDGDDFRAEIRDVETGETRQLPRAVYAVSDTHALCLNFARLHITRPGYGYPDGTGGRTDEFHPADEGVWKMDLATGECELIISLERLAGIEHKDEMDIAPMWVNHLTWSPGGTNFVFLNRWFRKHPRRPFSDRFYRATADGCDLRKVHDNGYFSHFAYRDETHLLGHARKPDGEDDYLMFDLMGDPGFEVIGGDVFDCDGHCNFAPGGRWFVTDTYPDAEDMRTLMLYDMETGTRVDIGRFHSPPELEGPLRCDLHPRWSRDGRMLSIDSAHEGCRRIYTLDVSAITGA
ncbi:hypothetical protein HKCCE2091_04620 [Rhodobacterales bacterium HKCCE2091]|nr:hypothetical protein [Rhodobacterales bacterium HKCCE2091]